MMMKPSTIIALPIGEDGRRIRGSVHYGGEEYVYHGETFHGARLGGVVIKN